MSSKLKLIPRSLLAVAAAFALLITLGAPTPAPAATTVTEAIVLVGQQGASSYEQSLNGVLYTVDQIGVMADRILWTEEQIGTMADRIVYVTELSMGGTIEIIYLAYSLTELGMQNGGYTYDVVLIPVLALPAGW